MRTHASLTGCGSILDFCIAICGFMQPLPRIPASCRASLHDGHLTQSSHRTQDLTVWNPCEAFYMRQPDSQHACDMNGCCLQAILVQWQNRIKWSGGTGKQYWMQSGSPGKPETQQEAEQRAERIFELMSWMRWTPGMEHVTCARRVK